MSSSQRMVQRSQKEQMDMLAGEEIAKEKTDLVNETK